MFSSLRVPLSLALLALEANAALYYPTPQQSLLEHILVDNWGAYASNFSSAITPCDRYVTQTGTAALTSGRTTAAQWMRVLFHDFITADVAKGTGGVDASIGFETAREENKGSAFNDSFTFWRPFVNEHVSMADLVALGTVMSNNLCGGKNMAYRAGRIDAVDAGITTGVPAPETSLEETLEFFERAGFGKEDAIGLTACGHTMGSVHHGGFPEVVDDSFVTPNNTNGGSNFDTTRGIFDPKVVGEYLNGTGNRGGPLVTSYNDTMNSDLRLYESDNNNTMRALFASGAGFLDMCTQLMGRAINTVPSGVQLGETITAMPVKPINVTYDFDENKNLVLSGKIRILTPAGSSPPTSLSLRIGQSEKTLVPEAETGTSVFGRENANYGIATYFPFALSGPMTQNATSFTIRGPTISERSFDIRSQVFIVPSATKIQGKTINVTVAMAKPHSCDALSVSAAVPITQPRTLAPKILRVRLNGVGKSDGEIELFTLCNSTGTMSGSPTGLVTVEAAVGSKLLDTLLVDGGMAGW